MTKPDYSGARGSNIGDDFHELWALRNALKLLDPNTHLAALTVEGLRAEDESGTPKDTWDGVDCTFYFGGDDINSVERIVVDQLKYSGANPDQKWTVARLTYSTNKKGDNSIIGKLAKVFSGLLGKRPDIIKNGNLAIRLVSNQQVDPAVIYTLFKPSISDQSIRNVIQNASGLTNDDFNAFVSVLDFSECGSGSRFALEECVLRVISEWTADDARSTISYLKERIHRAMLPEAAGEYITRESILAWMGVSDLAALFPCPSAIRPVEQLIPREVSQKVSKSLLSGNQRICLYGEGGCGKTTTLQEIETLLPRYSVVVIFDCYGGGRYLDSDAYRHRDKDAFLQLSNELARRLRIPLLLSQNPSHDYPRVFKRRLERAAEVVVSRSQDALLVVVVDAADNSIIAANNQSPPERSFVHNLVGLGELPANVRFILTTRTGRISSINLPRGFTSIEMEGFSQSETAAYVQGAWNYISDDWIEDFHFLSLGNPRVQHYALKYAGNDPSRALNYLRPSGKALETIFREKLELTLRKVGNEEDIKAFCSGLIALPRPIPLRVLSLIIGLDEAQIRDLCADLAPGIRLIHEEIGFADEDFEHFVRTEAETQLTPIRMKIADHFTVQHKSDPYAAAHIAEALFVAGRGQELIDLINTDSEPMAIGDPVLRREAQLKRLRTAMKVCRESENLADSMMVLIIGAEALKTDTVIRRILIENPDLAANFAQDTSGRIILRDPDEIKNHGPLLFHLMATDARNNDNIAVRERHRQVRAWLQSRNDAFREQKKRHPAAQQHGWTITHHDIAAETEAMLHSKGPRHAFSALRRWHPKTIALNVASTLSVKLIISGHQELVKQCINEVKIPSPWDIFLLAPLSLAGGNIDPSRFESGLDKLQRRRLTRLDTLKDIWGDEKPDTDYFDVIITACEVVAAHGGDLEYIRPVLEQIADRDVRRWDRLHSFRISTIDFSLRAHVILELISGRKATIETYLVDPPEPDEKLSPKEVERIKRANIDKKKKIEEFVAPLINIYDIRAQALMGTISFQDVSTQLQNAVTQYSNNYSQFSRSYHTKAMKTRLALSFTRLMVLPELNRDFLFECIGELLKSHSDFFGFAEMQIYTSLALDCSLHQKIIETIASRANAVKHAKTSSEEKINSLILFARLLLPISYTDAESIFNDAIDVASEINADAIHEIALLEPLSKRAMDGMSAEERRMVAHKLAIVVSDASLRLSGQEHFPWSESAQALASLDPNLALAAIARWEDMGFVDRDDFLPAVLEVSFLHNDMTPEQITALSFLFDNFSEDFIGQIADKGVERRDSPNNTVIVDHLAREELLRFGRGIRQHVYEKLSLLSEVGDANYWLERLAQATVFHEVGRVDETPLLPKDLQVGQNKSKSEKVDPFETANWKSHQFTSPDEIVQVVSHILSTAKAAAYYIPISDILDRIGLNVSLADRRLHLEALSKLNSQNVSAYEIAHSISRRIKDWDDSPSISRWCREQLLHIIVDLLPGFSHWLSYGESPLPELLERTGLPSNDICTALLEAMELHVEKLYAPTIYALIGLIGNYSSTDETVQVLVRYSDRLIQRIPIHEQDYWDLDDIPTNINCSLARYLFALMGDVDVRIRWRASHTLRSLAQFGDNRTLDEIVILYKKIDERSYRNLNAPFYWLAARLWLIMTLDRIADETPSALENHALWLLEIATDRKFPHVLLRAFAKSAVYKLIEKRGLQLDPAHLDSLKYANTTSIPREKARQPYSVGFDRYSHEEEDRRFLFNSIDTLPYWYTGAIRSFADLSGKEFLDTAEKWIVDHWGIQDNPWRWEDEPRKYRFPDNLYYLMTNDHGSMPTLERFHTYLEWHAMWCVTGELMQTRPLAQSEEDEYDVFENRLQRNMLTLPPLWLADLHGPKPLDEHLWYPPQVDVDQWVDTVGDDDFLSEIGLTSDDGSIIVSSDHDTKSRGFKSSIRVNSALVSPETASALVRALQTVYNSRNYRIPVAKDELEINNAPYMLTGWLTDTELHSGIDDSDPLRYEIRGIECRPSNETIIAMDLTFVCDYQTKWVKNKERDAVFIYHAWGDTHGDEREETFRHNETVRSYGWRLLVENGALKTFLNEIGRDLVVEIEITRRNKGYEYYSRYDEEKNTEARYDRVILLRRDGTIEAAEGCIGTWTPPRS